MFREQLRISVLGVYVFREQLCISVLGVCVSSGRFSVE
jgi:hypothetical protein